MHYVISDIHGELDKLKTLLEKIHFSDADELYVLGDVVDRGPHPIGCLQYLMQFPNVICLVGNHEVMALDCLRTMMQEVTDDFLDNLRIDQYGKILEWYQNGAENTVREFRALDDWDRQDIIDYLGEFETYAEVEVQGKQYILVHAGFDNFAVNRPLEDYSPDELVWTRIDYNTPYFNDKYVIAGHTPTRMIPGNPHPGYIFRSCNHIAIDCGAVHPDGRLAAFCLETEEACYSN